MITKTIRWLCICSAFLYLSNAYSVMPLRLFHRELALCPASGNFVHRRLLWEKKVVTCLFNSENDKIEDSAAPLPYISSIVDVLTPDEQDNSRQGETSIPYQDYVAYIMTTPFWRTYVLSKSMQPMFIKSFYSMTGFFLGDIIAQLILKKGNFDFGSLLRMGAFGGLVHGPSGNLFYGFLERKFPGATTSAVVKKICVDQLLWCPIFTVALFSFTGVTARLSLSRIFGLLRTNGPQVILSSWLIWPAAHAINFRVIPAKYRLLYINMIQLFFNIILSALANII